MDHISARSWRKCFSFSFLQEQNKCEVVQCQVEHDITLKHKAILDQLRSGLSILGFKKELEKAPAKFEHFSFTAVMKYHQPLSSHYWILLLLTHKWNMSCRCSIHSYRIRQLMIGLIFYLLPLVQDPVLPFLCLLQLQYQVESQRPFLLQSVH